MLVRRLSLVLSVLLAAEAHGGDWLEWRGPQRDGRSPERGLPARWSPAGLNLAWKAPYGGRSTPVVWGSRLYLQNAAGEGESRQERIVCLNADNGKLLWEYRFNVYLSDVPPDRVGEASPAVDAATGDVFAFGVGGTLLSLDDTGKLRWERSLAEDFGLVTTRGGRTGSPVLDGDLVIVSGISAGWGGQAPAAHRVFAFDRNTGATVYVSASGGRPVDTAGSPPLLAEVNGVRLMLAGGSDGAIHAIKPETGEPVWDFPMCTRGLDTGVLLSGTTAIVSHGGQSIEAGQLAGLDATASGTLSKERVRWTSTGFRGGSSSPVLDGDRLYQVDDAANLCAFDATSGRQLWTFNLGTAQKASPVLADGKLYVGTENGRFFILKPGPAGATVLDQHQLGTADRPEAIVASVAVSRGRVYLASTDALYCIGRKAPVETPEHGAPLPPGHEPATHLQVSPTELTLTPGDRVRFTVRLFDAQGRFIREELGARWTTEGLEGSIDAKGNLTTAGNAAQAGTVKATAGSLSNTASVRVIPALPWKWDFETGPVPPQWIDATGTFAVRDRDGGGKALVKLADDPSTRRARVFMGGGHLTNYTTEADAMAHGPMGDAGVVAQRYQLTLRGAAQEIVLESWPPETARTVHVPFAWKPETWYHLKLRVDRDENGAVRARGKAWPAADPEPEAWPLERLDAIPNLQGSPGLYADATSEVLFDNVRVTANGALPDSPPPRPPSPSAADPSLFDYDRARPLELAEVGRVTHDGVSVRDVTYANTAGGRTAAYLVAPAAAAAGQQHPAVLFVHWYAPGQKDSNRTQFLEQAEALARQGVVSLLIETMWSDPAWFRTRDFTRDYDHSVVQVRDLRRALDVLLSRPDVDPRRVAYVGHDFGAMYGGVLAGVDPRVTAGFALQAGTTSFADWFLLSAKLTGEARQKFIEQLSPLDPVHYIGRAGAPVLLQFARDDKYVPREAAEAFFAAAREPKEIRWYDAGHGLSEEAVADRQAWLRARLGLGGREEGK